MRLASLKSQRGFTLIELVAVLAIMGILAGVVAGAVTGFGTSAQETRIQGDENTIGSSADRFFDDAFPQVYPALDPDTDGNNLLNDSDEPPLPAGDLGIRVIDFDFLLPQESTISFVPDFLKEVPDSAALGSWRIDINSGNVFLAESGTALVKPSRARLNVVAATPDALDVSDDLVQSDHVFTLKMRKDDAPINTIEMVIPAGYLIGGQALDSGKVVGTLSIVFDINNPWTPGTEVTVAIVDVVTTATANEWEIVVRYDDNNGGTIGASPAIDIKNDVGAIGTDTLADERTHTISITPASIDSQGKLTLVIDRITELGAVGSVDYLDPDVNEATETWTLTIKGQETTTGTDIITNPGVPGVFRWLAEESTAIDNKDTFHGMVGNQAVVIR